MQTTWLAITDPPESYPTLQTRPFLNTPFVHFSYLPGGFYSDYSRRRGAWTDWAPWTLRWWRGRDSPLGHRWGRWQWSLGTVAGSVAGRAGCSHCPTSAREQTGSETDLVTMGLIAFPASSVNANMGGSVAFPMTDPRAKQLLSLPNFKIHIDSVTQSGSHTIKNGAENFCGWGEISSRTWRIKPMHLSLFPPQSH